MSENYYKCHRRQRHVHEFQGSTALAGAGNLRHNHRFAGVSGEAIPYRDSHVHRITTRTDFTNNHYHTIDLYSGPAIYIGGGKHIHLVRGVTSFDAGHVHQFIFATLIESPTEIKKC